MHISSWLRGWCWHEGSSFYDNGTFYEVYNLLEMEGVHLSSTGKAIFGSRLANLTRQTLN